VIIQRHDPAGVVDGSATDVTVGPVRIRHRVLARRGSRFSAVAAYDVGDRSWSQPYEAEVLDDAAVDAVLAAHGLRLEAWLDPRRTWARAGEGLGRSGGPG
jgi:hypothetical protein